MKQSIRRRTVIGLLLPVLTGVCVFMGSTLLGAELMRRGLIPMEFRRGIALASLAIGALLSGAVCGGGGKRGASGCAAAPGCCAPRWRD